MQQAPAAKLKSYKSFSEKIAKVDREYGAIRVVDCVLDLDNANGFEFHAEAARRFAARFSDGDSLARWRGSHPVVDGMAKQKRPRRRATVRAGGPARVTSRGSGNTLGRKPFGRRGVLHASRRLGLQEFFAFQPRQRLFPLHIMLKRIRDATPRQVSNATVTGNEASASIRPAVSPPSETPPVNSTAGQGTMAVPDVRSVASPVLSWASPRCRRCPKRARRPRYRRSRLDR